MAKSPSFVTIKAAPLQPVQRAAAQGLYTAAVKPIAVAAPWRNFEPEFYNRWRETLVASISTPQSGDTSTPGWTMGDADIAAAVLKIDSRVYLRLFISIGSSTLINTLVRDNGAITRTGDRGDTYMRLPYRIAANTTFQFGIYNYTLTRGVPPGAHGNQTPFTILERLATSSDELPITIWDRIAHTAVNPADGVAGSLQAYWTEGDVYDLQFEYLTDDIS